MDQKSELPKPYWKNPKPPPGNLIKTDLFEQFGGRCGVDDRAVERYRQRVPLRPPKQPKQTG